MIQYHLEYGQARLSISCDTECKDIALDSLIRNYSEIVSHINRDPLFRISYEPVEIPKNAPGIILDMVNAAKAFGVGPMASVAGIISQKVAEDILAKSGARKAIVDNGGDIYLKSDTLQKLRILYDRHNPTGVMLELEPSYTPVSICTSSSSIGHSISLGKANTATVFSVNGALADCASTKAANMLSKKADLKKTLEHMLENPEIRGCTAVIDGAMGAMGDLPKIIA
jgi:uncharacterized protein